MVPDALVAVTVKPPWLRAFDDGEDGAVTISVEANVVAKVEILVFSNVTTELEGMIDETLDGGVDTDPDVVVDTGVEGGVDPEEGLLGGEAESTSTRK